MTRIRRCLPVALGGQKPSVQEQRKALLTCPRCSHESPPDGDWRWVEYRQGTEVRCPDCNELLTVREQFEASSEAPK